jgi:NAD(P)-dependent dehydrogenase (short-subunit alcohol dehydrogenase family)
MAEKPIALVTGAGPGTGAAIVRRFASDGFRLIALARSPDLTSCSNAKTSGHPTGPR